MIIRQTLLLLCIHHYPPASKASREVANLTERKIYILMYMLSKNVFIFSSFYGSFGQDPVGFLGQTLTILFSFFLLNKILLSLFLFWRENKVNNFVKHYLYFSLIYYLHNYQFLNCGFMVHRFYYAKQMLTAVIR